MPRDLSAITKEDTLDGMATLTKSPGQDDNLEPKSGIDAESEEATISALSQRNEKRDELHPYTQTLKLSDIDSCVYVRCTCHKP